MSLVDSKISLFLKIELALIVMFVTYFFTMGAVTICNHTSDLIHVALGHIAPLCYQNSVSEKRCVTMSSIFSHMIVKIRTNGRSREFDSYPMIVISAVIFIFCTTLMFMIYRHLCEPKTKRSIRWSLLVSVSICISCSVIFCVLIWDFLSGPKFYIRMDDSFWEITGGSVFVVNDEKANLSITPYEMKRI